MCMYGYYGLLGLLLISGDDFKSTGPLEIYFTEKNDDVQYLFYLLCVSACSVNNSSVNRD